MTPDPESRQPPRGTYEVRGRSRRKLTATRMFLYRTAAPVAIGLIRTWWAMLGRTTVLGDERLREAVAQYGSIIPVYWHAHQLIPVRRLLQASREGLRLGFLISPSVDGELPAMVVRRAGGHVIRGSSNLTGARALRDYYEAVVKGRVSPAVTPDGPSGPRRQFKPGAVLLAQLTGKPMVPMAYAARWAWRFPTWDRFVLPLPFSRVVLAVGEPVTVPRGLDAGSLESWQERMRAELESLFQQARAAL